MPQVAKRTGSFSIEPDAKEISEYQKLAGMFRPQASGHPDTVSNRGHDAVLTVNGNEARLPVGVQELFEEIFKRLAAGDDITVVPTRQELTTTQAANLLNVSRQYLVRLCDEGKLPYRTEGESHRRLTLQDVLTYREQRDQEREAKFEELVRKSAEAGEYDLDITWPPQE